MEGLPTTGLRRGLMDFELDSEQKGKEKESGEVEETDPDILAELDQAFRAAVKEAWSSRPNSDVPHAYEAFLPVPWEETELCERADRHGNFDSL